MQEFRAGLPRLLYLGFAFPPGLAELNPGINPAGHALETRMISQLRRYFDIRSAGVLPIELPEPKPGWTADTLDAASGIDHEIILVEKPPELLHRLRSLSRLKSEYRRWQADGWEPKSVMVYNLSPIYNAFLRWLRRQPNCPKLVLLLLDSPNLGQRLRWLKRFRRRFKPLYVADSEMVLQFDACAGLSRATEKYFSPRGVPFMWIPGGCTPARALRDEGSSSGAVPDAQIRFGYFGALGPYAGAKQLAEIFIERRIPGTLEICGHGGCEEDFKRLAHANRSLKFHGLMTPDDSLRFGRTCDVLVNPRPITHGNENNFASKLFDYALTGRAILTSRLSGVELVLGPEAYYFDAQSFSTSLGHALMELAGTPRPELSRRGMAIQQRVISEYSWEKQCARLADFIDQIGPGAH